MQPQSPQPYISYYNADPVYHAWIMSNLIALPVS